MGQRLQRTVDALLEALDGYQPQRQDLPPGFRRAAVLMPLHEASEGVEMVFTKRTSDLAHHAGQISFPGGAVEDDDPSLAQAALRETCEEIGICGAGVEVVARLDQVVTISNFLVTPFLGSIEAPVEFRPNPLEVERLIMVPLSRVLDANAWAPVEIPWRGMRFKQSALNHKGDVIWGATARMLLNLRQALGGKAGQVACLAGNGKKPVDSERGLV